MRKMRDIAAVVLAVMSAAVLAQQDVPRFRSGVDVVQFTVTVLDKQRSPVTGLTADDFEVLVDGKPGPLAAFAAITLPADTVPASAASAVAPDVQTNQLPPEGRLVVLVMDRSAYNGSTTDAARAARAIAKAAIDRLGPADIAGVVYTASAMRLYSHGLTTDRARLRAAVDQIGIGTLDDLPPPPSLTEYAASRGAMPAPKAQSRVQLPEEERSGDCYCGVCVPDTLTALAKTLTGGMTRHKSIIFIGSSMALTSSDPTSHCAALIYPARDRLTRALDEANVTFHSVDPRGLEALGETAELAAPIGGQDMGANMLRQMILAILPDYTGGRVVVNSNKPEDAIAPLFDEDRSYYVLAIPRDPAMSKDEDRHRIKIGVKRSDLTVHTRNLYFVADPKGKAKPAPNAAAGALNELLPRGDFPLQMNLVPQFSADGSSEIRVLLGVASEVAGRLDVLLGAFDRAFKPAGDPLKQRLDVPASAVAGSAAFQWGTVLKPPPGDYEVRAAVATADGKRAASVIGYVDVPDVEKAGLALSGIVVKSGGAATLQREFAAGAGIGLSFQVARAKNAPAAATVRYTLQDALGQTIASADVPSERAVAVARGIESYEIGVRLPAVTGRYVATIAASNSRRTVRRQVPLTVR